MQPIQNLINLLVFVFDLLSQSSAFYQSRILRPDARIFMEMRQTVRGRLSLKIATMFSPCYMAHVVFDHVKCMYPV